MARRGSLPEFESWLTNARGLAPYTAKTYERYAVAAERWMSERSSSIGRCSFEELEAFHHSTPPTSASRRNARNALVAYFEFLLSRGEARSNHATKLRYPRQRRGLPRPVQAGAIPRILDAAERSRNPVMWRAILEIFLYTGLRLNEVRQLRWSEIEGSTARIRQKGGFDREVCLPTAVANSLQRWREKWRETYPEDNPFVFPSPAKPNCALGRNCIERNVKAFGAAAGVEGLTPHRFRHTFATHLYGATKDIMAVSQALGHQGLQNAVIYTKFYPEELRTAIDSLYEPAAAPEPRATSVPTKTVPLAAVAVDSALVNSLDADEIYKLVDTREFSPASRTREVPRVVSTMADAYWEDRGRFVDKLNVEQRQHFERVEGCLFDEMKWWLDWWAGLGVQVGAALAVGHQPDYASLARAAGRATDNRAEAGLWE